MRKILVLILLCLANSSAFCAGQYDGLYKDPNSPNLYYSVHQNAERLIVTGYDVIGPAGVTWSIDSVGDFTPRRSDIWNLYFGTIQGNISNIAGEVFFGACYLEARLEFDPAGAFVRVFYVNGYQTDEGRSQGANCSATFEPFIAQKVF